MKPLWFRLIRPSPLVIRDEERRRARLLSALILGYILVLIPLFSWLAYLASLHRGAGWTGVVMLGTAIVVYSGAYGFSRTRYFRAAGIFFVSYMNFATFLSLVWIDEGPHVPLMAMPYFAISFFVLSLFSRPRWLALNFAWVTLLIAVSIYTSRALDFEFGVLGFFFNACVFLVTWLGVTIRDADLRQIDSERLRYFQSSKLASLGEMAAGIAHEINNPLAIIKAHSSKLQSAGIPPDALASAQKIDVISDRIAKIIQGMRGLTRNSDRDQLELIQLRTVWEDVLAVSRERLARAGINLIVGEIPDCTVRGRPSQIGQVLLNLLNNAYDAQEGQTDKWIRVEGQATGERLTVSVTDSGKGIPLPVRQRIMEPFFTTKPPGKGTGLGLSISRKIIEDHGGLLRYDDTSPNTRFVIELRLARRQAA
ncbi:MAG: sensor histidine kinase [Bacteriovoracia bacterium]